jgi:TonB-linked SusC/RagA family outer membrane protein
MEIIAITKGVMPPRSLAKIILKTILLFCCTALLGFSSNAMTSQNPNITIDQDKTVTIYEVFDIIGQQTPCTFIYQSDIFKDFPKVELKKGTIKVSDLLAQCLPPSRFHITSTKDNYITITRRSGKAFQQNTIRGLVTDTLGIGMAGVNVLIKNTSKGTQTNFEGQYTITASANDTLVFTYVGYKTQEVAVGSATILNVVMEVDAQALDAVVINAGYYKVSDREKTGSIGRVDAAQINKQPINNPLEALQGRVTGVDIVQNSGVPGGGFKIRIRGQNSLMAGNEPLYIIDGVPYDSQSLSSGNTSAGIIPFADVNPLNAINPASIESIEILKDADATAIYGSRGANGVILITTKKGKEGKTDIVFESSTGIAHTARRADLLNTQQYLEMRREAFANDGITEYPEWAYDVNGTWDLQRDTDWQEVLTGGTANMRKLMGQVSGGSSNTQFLLSGQYQEETTVFPAEYVYDRLTVNTNLNHQGKEDRFKVVFTAGYTFEKNDLPKLDFTYEALHLPPNAPALYDEEGNLNWENSTWTNPLGLTASTYQQDSKNLISNTVLSYTLFKNFEMKVNAGYGFSLLQGETITPNTIYDPAYGLDSSYSTLVRSEGQRTYWITEPQVQYEQHFCKSHWNVLIGTTFQENTSEQESVMGKGFPTNNFLDNMSAATTHTILEENTTQYKYHSLFGRINYSYDDQFFVNATGRRDGSSRFGPNNKYGNFGAIGTAWIFTKEGKPSWLTFGKVRASYGVAGNDQIGDYQYLRTYAIQDYPYDGNIGIGPARLYNPNFKWEKITKREAALELAFIENKIALSVAYYNNRSSNQLVDYALPGTTGFTNIQANLDAEIENSGLEFELNGVLAQNDDFTWNSAFNLSLPRNRLLAFPGLDNSTYSNRYVIGEPLTIAKLYESQGVNPETGLFEFTDYNGDGAITSEDKQYIADLTPKFFGGLTNSLVYRNWSLDFHFQYMKRKGYNQYRFSDPPGIMLNQYNSVMDRWQQPGDDAPMQRFTTGADYDAYLAYSRFTQSSGIISDASFIRLRSLQLAYHLKFSKESSSSCRIYLQGLNLLTFTNYEGGDPEQTSSFLPPLRRISFGTKFYL